ncbi:hypothetical protein ACFQMH_34145 [Streptomyces viridiviolaceus]|uniref:Uncharacterized protein n=1 Tax=Streptomyces viridiviolaceus TaxID=68282 RepID=A0ABW2E925_9ACTN|nr:hypothetical protein [Streptomyces viridiviolaceus]
MRGFSGLLLTAGLDHTLFGATAAREDGSMTFLAPGEERGCTTTFRVGRLD